MPSPDRSPRLALGLDLGGTKVFAGLVDETGAVLRTWRFPTPAQGGGEAIMQALSTASQEAIAALDPHERESLVGIGVSSAGHIDPVSGKVLYCTPNLPGWSGMAIADHLRAAFAAHFPDLVVAADNDGNAATFGEAWCGGGQGVDNLVMMTIGTGLGGGIIVDGHLVHGSRAGGAEIGHTILVPDGLPCNCGQNGCLESYVSGTALGKAAARAGHWDPAPSSYQLFQMAREGDALALGLIREMAEHLATAIVTIINFVDPERILLGGGVGEQGDLFLPMVKEAVSRRYGERGWDPERVRMAVLGEKAGMIGAAGLVFDRARRENRTLSEA
ncbi:Glucokinase [compost metagenome]